MTFDHKMNLTKFFVFHLTNLFSTKKISSNSKKKMFKAMNGFSSKNKNHLYSKAPNGYWLPSTCLTLLLFSSTNFPDFPEKLLELQNILMRQCRIAVGLKLFGELFCTFHCFRCVDNFGTVLLVVGRNAVVVVFITFGDDRFGFWRSYRNRQFY